MISRSTDIGAALRSRRAQRGFFTMPGGIGAVPPSGGGSSNDPYWAFVTMLLKLDADFADSSPSALTVTPSGSPLPTIVASPSKFGGGSADLTGGGSSRLEIASDTAFDFAGGNFAIDLFAYRSGAGSGDLHILDAWSGRFLLRYAGGTIQFFASGVASPLFASSTAWATGAWRMLTVARSGNNWGLWFDGVSLQTATNAAAISSTATALRIGNSGSGDNFGGYIGPIRFTKGSARGYTPGVNFTPPSAMFPTA